MSDLKFILGRTADGLNLKGIYWDSKKNNTCIVFTPGMSGNIIEDNYPLLFGDYFSKNGVSFLYGHNRGHNHINEIEVFNKKTKKFSTKKYGAVYEKFEDSIYDVELWVNKAKELGYKKIILLGHSLGCNKNVYFYINKKQTIIKGLILLSPPDIVGMMKSPNFQKNYNLLLEEAKKLKENKSNVLMNNLTWGWYNLSYKTFFNMIREDSPIDVFPLIRNPNKFKFMEKLKLPILSFLADDDNIIKSPKLDLELLKLKTKNSVSFKYFIIKNTNHTYEKKELEVAKKIFIWIKKLV
jgi:alpha-beta hydrolase superfamily lysophospholipase